jgi:hypothetical protein
MDESADQSRQVRFYAGICVALGLILIGCGFAGMLFPTIPSEVFTFMKGGVLAAEGLLLLVLHRRL